ncbi:electron transfer flavoprotein beta subunit lysine methyltransferase [Lepus europaeus]|uniref:electron transfer flavoprotein beta subunit lysine methyltransferase n=1 Tax=Lepus europaeus TaxID=9983 RepID=UPI002B47E364|nr:electron transfer flavoprotein beta subunit lysine methyltransferase [Lepus europaeus]XP_062051021.1 electron transfer flavoprotein beta subunit lysine methyltransferase [Lepus europaeus]XP_062051022.1 electron transfer flavoprotein beta subunit lysine methyltransferase [Lepus europaeus]XP_062051023.1 electron transfer flavoprotein beta subunit lysine methyltransferase [Lepus europaeus]XP_062051024.1 electron transfer flavoprotein beta subunit lysine methyltransferase [Lepus europaeus]
MALQLGLRASGSGCRLLRAGRGGAFPLWPRGHCAGSSLDPALKAFLEENTEVTGCGSLTPEIQLRLLTPRCKFWWEKADLWPHREPYWAIYWPGGQALSRYILDNPDVVRGKSILDLGSGCGATAIAAKMSGASRILANDIDPVAGVAITLNCELNQLDPVPILTKDILNLERGRWDLVVLGDMFYDADLADSLHQWLKDCCWTHRTRVLIGDPGRPQFRVHSIQHQLHKVVEYPLTESTRQENNGLTTSSVWDFQP